MPPGSATEVIEVRGTKGVFHIVRHGLERNLAEKRARRLFGLGSEVGMCGRKDGGGRHGLRPHRTV
jgi:hypothetical protein